MQDSTYVCHFSAYRCANLQICKFKSLNLHQQTSTRSTVFTIDLAGFHHSPTSLQVLLSPCSASTDARDRRCHPDGPSVLNCKLFATISQTLLHASPVHSLFCLGIFLLSLGLLCHCRLITSHAVVCCRSTICPPSGPPRTPIACMQQNALSSIARCYPVSIKQGLRPWAPKPNVVPPPSDVACPGVRQGDNVYPKRKDYKSHQSLQI